MKKYYIGILLIGILSIGLIMVTISTGIAEKSDKITEKKVNEISRKLNDYVSKNRKIPESLDEIDVDDIPSTIKYTKKSSDTYEFCATFKEKSEYGGSSLLSSLIWGGAIGNEKDDDEDPFSIGYEDRESGSLYMYSHKKGENCQTVRPYSLASSRYFDDEFPIRRNGLSTTTNSSKDTERKSEINSIHAQLEVYYNENGYYPSLADVNSTSWRSANMKSLSTDVFKDPSGTSSLFAAKPAKNTYSYDVLGANKAACNNSSVECVSYTLTATLENGTAYSKLSLN